MRDWTISVILLDTLLIPILALICSLLWLREYWRYKNLPPGPRGWPIVGSLFRLGYKPYETLQKLSGTYGPVFSIKLGTQQTIVLNDFESAREAFIDQGDVFSGRPPIYFFDYGVQRRDVATSMGPIWRDQRTFMVHNMKSFGFGRTSSEALVMDSIQMVKDDIDASKGAPLSFQYLFFLPVVNVIWKYSANHSLPKDSTTAKTLCDIITSNFEGMSNQIVNFLPLLRFAPGGFGFWNQIRDWDNMWKFLTREVEDHQKRFVSGQHFDFIDVYLQEIHDRKNTPDAGKPPFRIDHLVGTLYNLFQAGADTTSNTLMWGLLLLSINPEKQRKVQAEMDEIIGRGREPCFADISKLPYLEALIQETQRYVSLVPLSVFHSTTRETMFRGYRIPKGTTVIQNLYAIHHDKKYWKDPEVFRPERFLDQNNKVLRPPALMPFSVGPRNCPGEPMARMELHLFFGCLLHMYNFALPPGSAVPSLEPVVAITLAPQPFSLCVTKRS